MLHFFCRPSIVLFPVLMYGLIRNDTRNVYFHTVITIVMVRVPLLF